MNFGNFQPKNFPHFCVFILIEINYDLNNSYTFDKAVVLYVYSNTPTIIIKLQKFISFSFLGL